MKKLFFLSTLFLLIVSCDEENGTMLCETPTNVTVSEITSQSAQVSWTSSELNAQYQIQIGITGFQLGEGQTYANSANPALISGLVGGTEYDVYVRAFCKSQSESSWTQVQTFTTLPACSEITSTNVTNITQTAALISWEYQGNFPISFIIEYSEEGFTPGNGNIAETSITNIPLGNLMNGIDYHYYLTAKCTGNNLGERVGPFSFSTLD